MSRRCKNQADCFCYICGEYTLKAQQRTMTSLVRKAYDLYFDCKVGDQDKPWAPHFSCSTCNTQLRLWLSRSRKSMPFAVPMVWREPKDHVTDCYFCLTDIAGHTAKTKKHIVYPNLQSAMRPVKHSDELPVPIPPDSWKLDSDDDEIDSDGRADHDMSDSDFNPQESDAPHLIQQSELNDLVRDLNLSKSQAELLGSLIAMKPKLAQVEMCSRGTDHLSEEGSLSCLECNFYPPGFNPYGQRIPQLMHACPSCMPRCRAEYWRCCFNPAAGKYHVLPDIIHSHRGP